MTNNIYIRRLTKDDIHSFFYLRLEALRDSPTSFLASYEDEKSSGHKFYENILNQVGDDNVIFGAFIHDQLSGIIGIYQAKYERIRHKGNIWGTFVKPEYRKYGVGKALMGKVIDHARNEMKCIAINLTVGSANYPAKKLYESLGFKTWGTEPKSILIDGKLYDEDYLMLVF